VAATAAFALGQLGDTAAVVHLAPYAAAARARGADGGGRGGVRARGAARFQRWDDLSFIAQWLDSPDAELRYRAAYVLSRRPDPRGTALLRGREGDAEPLVRQSVVRTLTAPLADSAGISREAALDVLIGAALERRRPGRPHQRAARRGHLREPTCAGDAD
jgi:HEAT repeat protein